MELNLKPSEFAKLSFGWNAFDYQIEPLNDMSSRVLMATGRQVGNPKWIRQKAHSVHSLRFCLARAIYRQYPG